MTSIIYNQFHVIHLLNLHFAFFLVLDLCIKLAYYKDHGWEERYITGAKNLVMKIYKEHYVLIEDGLTYDMTKTFNNVQSHIFSIGKKWHIQMENEFDEYLKILVASVDTNVLLWWKVSLFFRKNRLDFYKQIYIRKSQK